MGAISKAEVGQQGKSSRERTYLHAAVETMPREKLAKLQV
jgi:hypothetical protein